MNIKMATNSQLSTTKCKIQTKQTTRTGIQSHVCRLVGGLSAGSRKGANGGKGAGIKKYN